MYTKISRYRDEKDEQSYFGATARSWNIFWTIDVGYAFNNTLLVFLSYIFAN